MGDDDIHITAYWRLQRELGGTPFVVCQQGGSASPSSSSSHCDPQILELFGEVYVLVFSWSWDRGEHMRIEQPVLGRVIREGQVEKPG